MTSPSAGQGPDGPTFASEGAPEVAAFAVVDLSLPSPARVTSAWRR